jgi:hypothetical protein
VVPARRLFTGAALAGAAANALVLTADGLPGALVWRFATGVCLAGVYPPAMKMIATWFRARRGLAVGTVVGALTVGKALPYLVTRSPAPGSRPVTLAASAGALGGAALVWLGYREGPHPFPPRPFAWGLVAQIAREPRGASRRPATSATCGSCTPRGRGCRRSSPRASPRATRRGGARRAGGVGGRVRGARGGRARVRVGRPRRPTAGAARG